MTRLSVNVNMIALLRNQRDIGIPSVLRAAQRCVESGAHGITVHPRPDERHIRATDVLELDGWLRDVPRVEYNIEGNPSPTSSTSSFAAIRHVPSSNSRRRRVQRSRMG